MKKYLNSVIILIFLVISFSQIPAAREADIWIFIDRLSLEDILAVNTPALDILQEKGAFGLVNVRTAGDFSPDNIYLSLGSAGRARGGDSRYLPQTNPSGTGVLHPGIEELKKINAGNTYSSQPGYLGQVFREAGQTIMVLGNMDTKRIRQRPVVSLAMDEQGRVPRGLVGQQILQTTDLPWGYESDWEKLARIIRETKDEVDLIILELGDLERIENVENYQKNEIKSVYKKKYLQKIDNLITRILHDIDPDSSNVGVISPVPPQNEIQRGNKLSWILVAGPEIGTGWVTSLQTRRQGIVTLDSIAPTMAHLRGIKVQKPVLDFTVEDLEWSHLLKLNQKIFTIDRLRPYFIKGFIFLQLLVILMGMGKLLLGYRLPVIIDFLHEYLLMILFFLPLNFLLISIFLHRNTNIYILLLLFLLFVELVLLNLFIKSGLKRVVFVSMITLLILMGDLFAKQSLLSDSLLGYSSIIGARFYGLGNEYMGIFVGGSLVTGTGLLEIFQQKEYFPVIKKCIFVSLFFCIFVLGAPFWGANFGGILTMSTAVIFTIYNLYQQDLYRVTLFRGIILIAIIFLGVMALNFKPLSGSRTHIGQVIKMLKKGAWSQVINIGYRKLAMNLKLLRWTIWTKILLSFMLYLIFLFIYPYGKIKQFISTYPFLTGGIYGSIWASIVAILVNDSGVVAAATVLFFPVLTIIFLGNEYMTEN